MCFLRKGLCMKNYNDYKLNIIYSNNCEVHDFEHHDYTKKNDEIIVKCKKCNNELTFYLDSNNKYHLFIYGVAKT